MGGPGAGAVRVSPAMQTGAGTQRQVVVPRPRQPPPASRLQTISSLLRILLVALFVLTFLFQTYRIPSASMEPTLEIGDFVLVSKVGFRTVAEPRWEGRLIPQPPIARGDLAVFHFPPQPRRLLVKRIIGLPGDRLYLRNGRVFLNGRPLREPYALYTAARPDVYRDEFPNLHEADPGIDPAWWLALRRTLRQDGELPIPPGHYFVLGDNRNNSEDSRYWGFVRADQIIGQPLLVYWSVPNGAGAPEGGVIARLRWVSHWVKDRTGILR